MLPLKVLPRRFVGGKNSSLGPRDPFGCTTVVIQILVDFQLQLFIIMAKIDRLTVPSFLRV